MFDGQVAKDRLRPDVQIDGRMDARTDRWIPIYPKVHNEGYNCFESENYPILLLTHLSVDCGVFICRKNECFITHCSIRIRKSFSMLKINFFIISNANKFTANNIVVNK